MKKQYTEKQIIAATTIQAGARGMFARSEARKLKKRENNPLSPEKEEDPKLTAPSTANPNQQGFTLFDAHGRKKRTYWDELDKLNYLQDLEGYMPINDIRGQKFNSDAQEDVGPMELYEFGTYLSVYNGFDGLHQFSQEVEASNKTKWENKDPMQTSIVRIENLDLDGVKRNVYCVATASKEGVTKTFIDGNVLLKVAKEEQNKISQALLRVKLIEEFLRTKSEDEIDKILKATVTERKKEEIVTELEKEEREGGATDKEDTSSEASDDEYNEVVKRNSEKNSNYSCTLEYLINSVKETIEHPERSNHKNRSDIFNLISEGNFEDLDEGIAEKLEEKDSLKLTDEEQEQVRRCSAITSSRIIGEKANSLGEEIDTKGLEEKVIKNRNWTKTGIIWHGDNEKEKAAYKELVETKIRDNEFDEGIRIDRSRGDNKTATVLFKGNSGDDIAYLAIPDAPGFYVQAKRLDQNGETMICKNGGRPTTVHGEPGSVMFAQDTIFYLGKDGKHEPVSTNLGFGLNSPLQRFLNKIGGVGGGHNSDSIVEAYKNFKVKAVSRVVDEEGKEKDHMTTLFKGETDSQTVFNLKNLARNNPAKALVAAIPAAALDAAMNVISGAVTLGKDGALTAADTVKPFDESYFTGDHKDLKNSAAKVANFVLGSTAGLVVGGVTSAAGAVGGAVNSLSTDGAIGTFVGSTLNTVLPSEHQIKTGADKEIEPTTLPSSVMKPFSFLRFLGAAILENKIGKGVVRIR